MQGTAVLLAREGLDAPPKRCRHAPLPSRSPASYAARCTIALLVVMAALRITFSIASNAALSHPDEHQQYLEQAFVHAYGYGVTFWEQDRHMRHPLLVAILGQTIRVLDAVGVGDPASQAIAMRIGLGLASLTAILAWAWRWHRDGESPAAVFLLIIMAVSIDVAWIQSRVLSDNALAAPLILALLFERRWPGISGALLAVLFAVRFQMGLWIAPAVVTLAIGQWLEWRRRRDVSLIEAMTPMLRLSCGFLGGAAVLFGGEWMLYGKCSPWEYWRACIVEGGAAQFGVDPWYFYLVYGTRDLLRASILLPLALWFGARCEGRLTACTFAFLLAHTLVGHKEMRFAWDLMPILALLAARGFGEIWKRSPRRGVWAVAIVLSLAIPSLLRVPFYRWQTDDYAESVRALDFVSRQSDVAGVVVLGTPDHRCGNYFYLRRDVPLVQGPRRIPEGVDRATHRRGPLPIDDDLSDLVAQAERTSPPPNYWLVPDYHLSVLPAGRFESVGRYGALHVLRRDD